MKKITLPIYFVVFFQILSLNVFANWVPGTFNSWNTNTPMSETNMPLGFKKFTTLTSDDQQFQILKTGSWNDGGWGSGYWINSWNTVWNLPFTGTNMANSVVKSFGTNQYMSIVTSSGLTDVTSKFGFLITRSLPIYISAVSGGTTNVALNTSVAISITLSAEKSIDEYVLIRYTTDNWSTSGFVTATGSGTSYSATIPGQTSNKTVKWYAMTSTIENPVTDTDYLTLCVMDNSRNNYSYYAGETSSTHYFRSKVTGNWNTAGNWESSDNGSSNWITATQVPGSSAAGITILNGHNITLNTDVTITSLTINSGATFTASDATPRTLTITKSTSGSSTTLSNTGTWANGVGGSTVVFSGAPNAGDAIHAISGTISFQNITINKTSGSSNVGASFGSGSTVSGTLEVGYGGFVSTAPPSSFYNSTAVLKFNQGVGATYNVNAGDYSWSATEVPQNITVSSGTVNLNANRTATGNLLINGGALVLNNNTPNLTINGNWTRTSGSFTANTGTVTLGGSTNGTVNVTGGATMNSLVISKSTGYKAIIDCNLTSSSLSVNSNATLEVNPGKQLTVSSALTNNGTLTLKSNSTDGTATLKALGTVTNGGATNYNVEQYLTGSRNWYISSPISSGTMPTAGYERDEVNAEWDAVSSGAAMSVGKGYIVQPGANTTITFAGTINNNEPTVSLSRTTGQTKAGFNLIGNPYPCYYTWSKAQADASNLLYTVWYRTKDGSYTFHTFNMDGEISSPASVTNYIPPMQAFWVRVDADSDGSEDITFLKANRSHADVNTNKLKAPKVNQNKILRLDVSNGTNSDETVLYFNENAANNYDSFDSPKMSNNSTSIPEIYTLAGSEQLVINGMQSLSLDTDIPLGFRTLQANSFVIKATELTGFDTNTKVYIRDNQNLSEPEVELTLNKDYTFTSGITDDASRFSIVFKSSGAVTGLCSPLDLDNLSVYVDKSNKISVNLGTEANNLYKVEVYNSFGQKVAELKTKNSIETINKNFTSGVYFVKVNINNLCSTQKVIIK